MSPLQHTPAYNDVPVRTYKCTKTRSAASQIFVVNTVFPNGYTQNGDRALLLQTVLQTVLTIRETQHSTPRSHPVSNSNLHSSNTLHTDDIRLSITKHNTRDRNNIEKATNPVTQRAQCYLTKKRETCSDECYIDLAPAGQNAKALCPHRPNASIACSKVKNNAALPTNARAKAGDRPRYRPTNPFSPPPRCARDCTNAS